jgi:hypothetical protein
MTTFSAYLSSSSTHTHAHLHTHVCTYSLDTLGKHSFWIFSLIYLSFYTSQFLKNVTKPHQTIHSSSHWRTNDYATFAPPTSSCHNFLKWKIRLMTFSQVRKLKHCTDEILRNSQQWNWTCWLRQWCFWLYPGDAQFEETDYPEYSCCFLVSPEKFKERTLNYNMTTSFYSHYSLTIGHLTLVWVTESVIK